MYDMHYDLLTILYYNFMSNNKFRNQDKLINDLKKIYNKENIIGGIINLYFMSIEEMKMELDIEYDSLKNPVSMFKDSIDIFKDLKNKGIIPLTSDFIFGIEGCDYIEIDDLKDLKSIGLKSIVLVWNNKNKYGSGINKCGGLTIDGEKFINRAIDLNIAIDVSHSNIETFYDILNIVRINKDKKPIVFASHSNARTLCNRERNLTDEQLLDLKNSGGYIGLIMHAGFCNLDFKNLPYKNRGIDFLKQLRYLTDVIKYDLDKIFISTDDMNYHPDSEYHNREVFPFDQVNYLLRNLLKDAYSKDIIDDFLINNPKNFIKKLNI